MYLLEPYQTGLLLSVASGVVPRSAHEHFGIDDDDDSDSDVHSDDLTIFRDILKRILTHAHWTTGSEIQHSSGQRL